MRETKRGCWFSQTNIPAFYCFFGIEGLPKKVVGYFTRYFFPLRIYIPFWSPLVSALRRMMRPSML